MSTGRKIANGSNGKGEASVRKTPLMAAVQATAAQSVNGTMIASQVVRRSSGVRSVRSRPSHKPSAINPWTISRTASAGTPLPGSGGGEKTSPAHSTERGRAKSGRPKGGGGETTAGEGAWVDI